MDEPWKVKIQRILFKKIFLKLFEILHEQLRRIYKEKIGSFPSDTVPLGDRSKQTIKSRNQ